METLPNLWPVKVPPAVREITFPVKSGFFFRATLSAGRRLSGTINRDKPAGKLSFEHS